MIFEVDPIRWEIKDQKALSRLPAVYNKIHEEMPDLIFELAHNRYVAERYVHEGRAIDETEMSIIITRLERILDMDCRQYRLPPEKLVKWGASKKKFGRETYRLPADRYHFLCYVRDLVKTDPELFNAMRFYATL